MARENLHYARYKFTRAGLTCILQSNSRTVRNGKRIKPTYDLPQFRAWCASQPDWERLFTAWEDSGFEVELKPGLIRIDHNKRHSLDNIRLAPRGVTRRACDNPVRVKTVNWMRWRAICTQKWDGDFVL